ncbi:hypothetical protein [Umezawaea sp.]
MSSEITVIVAPSAAPTMNAARTVRAATPARQWISMSTPFVYE